MLWIFRLSGLESWMKHCLFLFLCMAETMLWREKDGSKIRAVQMDNLRGLLGIKRMDRVLNVWIRELFGVKKGLDERIDEGMLR